MPSTKEDHFKPDAVGLSDPHPHDILAGRGGASNNHMGNKIYRTIVEHNKSLYSAAERHSKLPYAIAIVDAIEERNPPGRFLDKKEKGDDLWYEVTRKRAIDKTAQALREKVHKAIMLPLSEIPEDFAHLVGEESEAIAAAVAASAAAKTKKTKGGKKATRNGGKRKKGQGSRSGAGSKAKRVKLAATTTLADPDALVETALRPSTSLFNFFGIFGGGSNQGDAGATAEAAAAVTDNGEQFVSAAAAAAGPSVASSPSPPRKKKKRRIRTAATVEAKAAIESQEMLRETTLSTDISSFLPSFLERGVTHIMDTLGPPVTSLGTRITGCFSSGGSAGDGQGTLVPPPPIPPPTGLKRADTLTGDDDDEEDPAVERLRMIPPSLNGTGSMSSFGAINGARLV